MSKLILRGKCQELLDNNGLTGYHVDVHETYQANYMTIETECGKKLVTFSTIQFATKNIKAGEIACAMDLLEQFLLKESKNIRKMHTLENQIVLLSADLSKFPKDYSHNVNEETPVVSVDYLDKNISIQGRCQIKHNSNKFAKTTFSAEIGADSATKIQAMRISTTITTTITTMLNVAKKLHKIKTSLMLLRADLSSCKI